MGRISIPANINDRVSIETRNKSNGACSSSAMIPCILHPRRPGCHRARAVSRPYPIYFTSTFERERERERGREGETALSIDANLYTYKTRDTSGGLLRNRILPAPVRRKILEYLERFRLNSAEVAKNFSLRPADISLACYRHTHRQTEESIYKFANGHSVLPLPRNFLRGIRICTCMRKKYAHSRKVATPNDARVHETRLPLFLSLSLSLALRCCTFQEYLR